MSEFRIESGWLVRDVNEHTCGSSATEWPYAHEPGCGTIPELRLDDLPGWPGADAAAAARALRDAADAVPVDLWCTYGMAARAHVEGFQEWLRERADRIEADGD